VDRSQDHPSTGAPIAEPMWQPAMQPKNFSRKLGSPPGGLAAEGSSAATAFRPTEAVATAASALPRKDRRFSRSACVCIGWFGATDCRRIPGNDRISHPP
jgi:hypothetical protein